MPAVPFVAFSFVAGVAAGLSFIGRWGPWVAVTAAALAALAALSAPARVGLVAGALASGLLWGGTAARAAARDCRRLWGPGEHVALLVALWDQAPPGASTRALVVGPDRCRGPIVMRLPPRGTAPRGLAAATGAWWPRARWGPAWLPVRPLREGELVAARVRPLGSRGPARVRIRLLTERRLEELFGPARAPVAVALTLGSGDHLDRGMRQRFARAGLAHILAISGLHVGLIFGALMQVLRAARLPREHSRIAATLLSAAYVWLLGLPAPAVRALGLLALWSWARLRQRPPVPYAALAGAAALVALTDPFAVAEPGPWLSFAGAAGCVAALGWWAATATKRRHRSAWAGVGKLAAVSAGAFAATAPISALVFGTISPVAVVANLAAVPLAALVVPALALAAALSFLGSEPAGLVAGAAGLGLSGLDGVATLAASVPGGWFPVDSRPLAALASGVLVWWLFRAAHRRRRGGLPRPYRWPASRRRWRPGPLLIPVMASAAIVVWWPLLPAARTRDKGDRLAIHFLSVGQGDAALIRTPAGRWVVIDGGPRFAGYDAGRAVLVPFLRRLGVRRLALVVASHGDADHLGGLPALLRAIPAELVLEPGEPLGGALYRRWLAAVTRTGAAWRRAQAGDTLVVDGVRLTVWHPDSGWIARGLPVNENSLVLTVEYGGFRALFPGDAGAPMEAARAGAVGRVAVLKVGHHGSASASGEEWLRSVRPRVCVISVGPNRFGHPASLTLWRLRQAGCAVYRTDRDGTIEVATDGRRAEVRARGVGAPVALEPPAEGSLPQNTRRRREG